MRREEQIAVLERQLVARKEFLRGIVSGRGVVVEMAQRQIQPIAEHGRLGAELEYSFPSFSPPDRLAQVVGAPMHDVVQQRELRERAVGAQG